MKNNTLLQTLRKQMSNQIHYDYRPHVSPMTTEGMKSMSPSKQMTRNQINTNTIKPKRKATGIASLGPATRLNMSVGDCISSLCINPSYIDRLLNSSFFTRPIYNKCILPSYTGNRNIFTFGSAGKISGQFINYMNGIVYAGSSIRKCSNPANPSQNTSIKNQKSARGKQVDTKVIKPIPNETTESCGQKTDSFVKSLFCCKNSLSADDTKKILNEWIGREYQPTHFLTLQLPENKKSADLMTSIRHLKNIMKAFEKSLMNNWNRHHLRFITFAENGISDDWHFHILFNQGKFTEQKLQNAILKVTIRERLPFYSLKLDKIDENMLTVDSYCTKEIKIYWDGKFDSDRIIFSECLFGL
ncbi:MAG: hypothetical protein V8R23_05285 [Alphaproteobacteria bacterium]